jgi:glutamine cyclotransferase
MLHVRLGTMSRFSRRRQVITLVLLTAWSCDRPRGATDFVVTGSYPHDATAYTQGLVTVNGVVYESTGLYGYSDVRRIELETGAVVARHALHPSQFGEGLAFHQGRLYQLTWREGVAYAYLPDGLTPADSFRFSGEGWGLTSDGTSLFLSDGSDSIRVLNPQTFAVERSVKVRHGDLPLTKLNELEYFDGKLLANVYGSDRVAMIDPVTGVVTRLLDFGSLYTRRAPTSGVMNGIAVAADGKHLLLTGKFWPAVFQLRLTAPS